jgi:hypothetical protein
MHTEHRWRAAPARDAAGASAGGAFAPAASPLAAALRHGAAQAWRVLPALLPALLFLPAVLAPPLNHDVAAVLNFSERWLAGEHLYSDLIDVNPPLIYVLNLIPAALARLTPLSAVASLHLCLLLFGAVCWRLAYVARDRAAEGAIERRILDVLPAFFLLAAGYDFGQREHLMAVAALPYLLGASRRATGAVPRGRNTSAVIAAIGFALKPHFMGIPVLVELAVLLSRKREGGAAAWLAAIRGSAGDATPWIMAGVWLLYAASLPLLFADYLNTVVPLVWDLYLDLGGYAWWQVLLVPRLAVAALILLPCACAVLARALTPPAGAASALPRMLAAAGLGALASAIAQHKGWSYHILPVELFAVSLSVLLAGRFLDRATLPARPSRSAVAAILTSVIAFYAIMQGEAPWKELGYRNSAAATLTRKLRQFAQGQRVLVLSPGIYPIYPAINDSGTHLTLRTMNMWLLQGAYETCPADGRRYREVWQMKRPEFFVFRTVAEDFAKSPPAAVVIDKNPGIPYCGSEFSFVAYFSRHPLFAEMWSHYRLAAEWDRYQIYTRKD